jgi:hypothetical protein
MEFPDRLVIHRDIDGTLTNSVTGASFPVREHDVITLSPDGSPPLQRLGTRAVVAEVLVAEAEKVARTVEHLLDAGAEGDLAAAKALVPWIDQAYGKPTERVEHRVPSSVEELEQMSMEELERLVAQGRARRLQRLQAVPDPTDWRARSAPDE